MNLDEAKKRVAAQKEELATLESQITQIATVHSGPVLMAIVRALVDVVCAEGRPELFLVTNKINFYRGVLGMLAQKGIR